MTLGNQTGSTDDSNDMHRSPRSTGDTRARSVARVALSALVTVGLAAAAVACGDDSSESSEVVPPATDSGVVAGLDSEAVARGEAGARAMGCAGCHGQDFDGGAGPGWIGLAGSEVVLADGSTVIADDAYLTRAIADPDADLREGYNLRMPANSLTDEAIADIVAYINSLADA